MLKMRIRGTNGTNNRNTGEGGEMTLLLGIAIGIIIIILTTMMLAKTSDHFNLYIKLRLVHLQIDFGSKRQAFSEYYEKVRPHYKRLENQNELTDRMLDQEIRRLNTKARIRLGKIRLKIKIKKK